MAITSPIFTTPWQRNQNKKLGMSTYSVWFVLLIFIMVLPLPFINTVIAFNLDNVLSVLSYCAIGIYAVISLYYAAYARPFSMNCSHWVFVTFFLAYVPLAQFLTNDPARYIDVGAVARDHMYVNGLIFLWCVFYSISYKYFFRKQRKEPIPVFIEPIESRKAPNYWLLTGVSILAAVITLLAFGLAALTTRYDSGHNKAMSQELGTFALIVGIYVRAMPVLALALIFFSGVRNKLAYGLTVAVIGLVALFSNNPLSVARFWGGTLMIALTCTLIRRWRWTGIWLPLMFFVGFMFVMPFLNLFRLQSLAAFDITQYQPLNIQRTLDSGDFDAYDMLCNTVDLNANEITWGRQLFGNLVFFIPRSMWAKKPIGSGAQIAADDGLSWTNLSEPLPAEGYINFGVLGVLIYALGFGALCATLDGKYWRTTPQVICGRPTLLQLMYPSYIGLTIFMMRGDFLSSFSYSCGFVACGWTIINVGYPKIIQRIKVIKPNRQLESVNI